MGELTMRDEIVPLLLDRLTNFRPSLRLSGSVPLSPSFPKGLSI